MQTSRFQLGLMATLALGLGFSLASSPAIGYPAGAAVSMGENPRWSATGMIDGSSTVDLFTVPAGQVAIVTGMSTNESSWMDLLQDDVVVMEGHSNSGSTGRLFSAGTAHLTIDTGATLKLRNTTSTAYYYVEGYYAQP